MRPCLATNFLLKETIKVNFTLNLPLAYKKDAFSHKPGITFNNQPIFPGSSDWRYEQTCPKASVWTRCGQNRQKRLSLSDSDQN